MFLRSLLACILTASLAHAALIPLPTDKRDSWVSKKIMLKHPGVRISNAREKDEAKAVALLTDLVYHVEAEQDGWLRVNHHGIEGWFEKEHAVLVEDAVAFFTERLRAEPDDARAYAHRAWAYKEQGKFDAAVKDYGEAIRLQPQVGSWYNNRGVIWSAMKEHDNALADYTEAIRLGPGSVTPYVNRAQVWIAKKEFDRALDDCQEAIRLDPKYPGAYLNRGRVWWKKKDFDKVLADCDEAIRLAPSNPGGYNLRAWLYATCPDEKYRDGKKAVEDARRACEMSAWRQGSYIDTLAAAYAEAGDFRRAAEQQRRALEFADFARTSGDEARRRLELYQQSKPYREP